MNYKGLIARASRADLITALLGQAPDRNQLQNLVDAEELGADDLGLLYEDKSSIRPAAIVLRRGVAPDFFAWLETYAPQFSPLTQTCRVIYPEMTGLYARGAILRRNLTSIRALSGAVVGEVIAQTANNPIRSLDSATLVHAYATFSFCLAKAELLHGAGLDCRRDVLSGLELLAKHGLVAERLVSVKDLFPFWNVAFRAPSNGHSGTDLIGSLAAAVDDLSRSDLSSSSVMRLARFYEPARELMMLHTYSAEERVLSFDRLIGNVGFGSDDSAKTVEDFCLAYAAVEIGGGSTRHIGLLQEYGERRPMVWLWFGLLASLGGDDKWHPAFARLGKLVQRELQYSFDPWDAPRSDIALDEYLSIRSGSSKANWASSIPRSHARFLSVEMVPGVSFQLSIGAPERKENTSPEPNRIDLVRLDQALSELWAFRESIIGAGKVSEPQLAKATKRPARGGKSKKGLF